MSHQNGRWRLIQEVEIRPDCVAFRRQKNTKGVVPNRNNYAKSEYSFGATDASKYLAIHNRPAEDRPVYQYHSRNHPSILVKVSRKRLPPLFACRALMGGKELLQSAGNVNARRRKHMLVAEHVK